MYEDKNVLVRFVWNYFVDVTSNTVSFKMCEGDGFCVENIVCVGCMLMSVGECYVVMLKYMLVFLM